MKYILKVMIIVCLLSGCTSNIVEKQPNNNDNEKFDESNIQSILIMDYTIVDMEIYDDLLIVLYSISEENLSRPQSLIKIYDNKNYQLLHEVESGSYVSHAEIVTKEYGFYIDPKLFFDPNKGLNITVYDYQLQVVREFDLEPLQNKEARRVGNTPFSLSNDLQSVAYIDLENNILKTYNFIDHSISDVYVFDFSQIGSLAGIINLYFLDNYIAFTGSYNHEVLEEFYNANAYGRININTKALDIYFKKNIVAKNYENHLLVVDTPIDIEDLGTGEVIVYDVINNYQTVVQTNESRDSFDVDIVSPDILVSYDNYSKTNLKLVVYQNGNSKVIENVLPDYKTEVHSAFNPNKGDLIVYYQTNEGAASSDNIKVVNLK